MTGTSLRRDAGKTGLLLASIGGMIGSGWLFGALNAAKMAGPAALISWVLGAAAVALLAFVYAELSTLFPRPGAVIAFPLIAFGPLAAEIMAYVNFLAYCAVAPIEALAVTNYAANLWPALQAANATLTPLGLAAALALMVLFTLLNLGALRLVLRFNNALTAWKLAIPALTVAALAATRFHPANFTAHGFAPFGAGGIVTAISGSGIIFTFLGFRQAIELAGETANPAKSLPFAILGSVALCALLYLGLQAAFIGALPAAALAHGWSALSFPGIEGPFAGLAAALSLPWLAALLYLDAALSPAGAGIIYNTTAARVIYAISQAGMLPRAFTATSRQGAPIPALILSFLAGICFLAPLPSWQHLVATLSSIGVLAYGIGPVVLVCLRATLPESQTPRPFRLFAYQITAPAAFIVSNLIVFWAGAGVANTIFPLILAATLASLGYRAATQKPLAPLKPRQAAWLIPHLGSLWLITALGPQHGPHLLTQTTGAAAIALTSLATLALARRSALRPPDTGLAPAS
ncbi:APC family permease [Acidocella sp.]|uniref:APC family permease n=1 Tax=Acidocella sp. TaxID=50710 RepID=UPI00262C92A2|nr:APC family permease [Acidocella sp.]